MNQFSHHSEPNSNDEHELQHIFGSVGAFTPPTQHLVERAIVKGRARRRRRHAAIAGGVAAAAAAVVLIPTGGLGIITSTKPPALPAAPAISTTTTTQPSPTITESPSSTPTSPPQTERPSPDPIEETPELSSEELFATEDEALTELELAARKEVSALFPEATEVTSRSTTSQDESVVSPAFLPDAAGLATNASWKSEGNPEHNGVGSYYDVLVEVTQADGIINEISISALPFFGPPSTPDPSSLKDTPTDACACEQYVAADGSSIVLDEYNREANSEGHRYDTVMIYRSDEHRLSITLTRQDSSGDPVSLNAGDLAKLGMKLPFNPPQLPPPSVPSGL
ncbi:MAG: hypothetical protein ACRCTR_07740 [Actinomycetota bacterium]